MGRLIVIEGLDGSGKSTQVELLPGSLKKNGYDSKSIAFPDYNDPSSTLVRMYLGGDFGDKPDDVNAYAASLFYAVDRYASFKRHWGEYYENGGIVIAGRYTTSNSYHQTSKLPKDCWKSYIDWLYETEYGKIKIPKPDLVIFLDMPIDVSDKLMSDRYHGDESKRDIHEKDKEYLNKCRDAALFAAKYSGWKIINCAQNGKVRSIEDIHNEIISDVLEVLKQKTEK